MNTPDAVFHRWVTLRAKLERAPETSLAAHRIGVEPAAVCPTCGADAVTHRIDRDFDGEELSGPSKGTSNGAGPAPDLGPDQLRPPWASTCRACGRAWPLELIGFFEPRGPGRSVLLAELATLGAVLAGCRFPVEERRLYLGLYLAEGLECYERVALEANRRWPAMRPIYRGIGPIAERWTRATVRRVVADGRLRILDAMVERGIWSHA